MIKTLLASLRCSIYFMIWSVYVCRFVEGWYRFDHHSAFWGWCITSGCSDAEAVWGMWVGWGLRREGWHSGEATSSFRASRPTRMLIGVWRWHLITKRNWRHHQNTSKYPNWLRSREIAARVDFFRKRVN